MGRHDPEIVPWAPRRRQGGCPRRGSTRSGGSVEVLWLGSRDRDAGGCLVPRALVVLSFV